MHRTRYPASSNSGTSRPPMYPVAPVTRHCGLCVSRPLMEASDPREYANATLAPVDGSRSWGVRAVSTVGVATVVAG